MMEQFFSVFLDSIFDFFIHLVEFPPFQVFFLCGCLVLVFFGVLSIVRGRRSDL